MIKVFFCKKNHSTHLLEYLIKLRLKKVKIGGEELKYFFRIDVN
jgi:hypothetical protein